ncbi:MAG: holo-ACP synthase [Candidatus Cloacimonetes bacterium]|nr:holo-ACP synthase [Candidatus Cloacimonadota bacterium]
MIQGIGTDIIAVKRIQNAFERNPAFGDKVFTPAEIAYCQSRAHPYQSFAARFAAKEAVMKACGTGWNADLTWQNIEVVSTENGAPSIRTYHQTAAYLEIHGIHRIHLSLSHDGEYATAFVVLERN